MAFADSFFIGLKTHFLKNIKIFAKTAGQNLLLANIIESNPTWVYD
ncbi:hypothetical protein [Anaerovibrio lipolyticus]|nr:hypothetical protein [Anaerovibrio lipolyticus]